MWGLQICYALCNVLLMSTHVLGADELIVNTENGKVVGEKRINTQDQSEYCWYTPNPIHCHNVICIFDKQWRFQQF